MHPNSFTDLPEILNQDFLGDAGHIYHIYRNNFSFLGTIDQISANLKLSVICNNVFFNNCATLNLAGVSIFIFRYQNEHKTKQNEKVMCKLPGTLFHFCLASIFSGSYAPTFYLW